MNANLCSHLWNDGRAMSLSKIIVILLLVLGINTLAQAQNSPNSISETSAAFFSAGPITLNAGDSITPSYPLYGSNRAFNFSLNVSGSGPVALDISNGSGGNVWTGTAEAGETIWGSGTLTPGQNKLKVTNNNGSNPATFTLTLYDIPTAPYTWQGKAVAAGINSQARVNFPSSGLYTFNLGVNSGRYQLLLDDDHIQKTAEASSSVTYFVPAGNHNLKLVQDTGLGADWSVAISAAGAGNDSLPYNKTGGDLGGSSNDFAEEWLPIRAATATQVNLALSLTGAATDKLSLALDGTSLSPVYGGETVWATVDLPAGTSFIHLTADGANTAPLGYDLTITALPGPTYNWTGGSTAAGLNSQVRLNFAQDGLYTFAFGVSSGSYQLLLDDNHIQKTVSSNTSATYFVPAGIHELEIVQDSTSGANWTANISLDAAGNNSLPYDKSGHDLGGSSSFDEEWLPISLDAATTVNLSLEVLGDTSDGLSVEVYNSGSTTPDFAVSDTWGSESIWANFPLTAGVNRLHLTASGNSAALDYNLSLNPVPSASAAVSWNGDSLAAGTNSQFMVDFPSSGLYRFEIDNGSGFANLLLDDVLTARQRVNAPTASGSSYDMMVTAGTHEVVTVQDGSFATTDWTATITPVSGQASFFTFDGEIAAGDTVTPEFPLSDGPRNFNFSLASSGGDADLTIRDGSDSLVWADTAFDGETVWGTGTLTNGINKMILTNNGGSAINVSLVLYDIPAAPHTWTGAADGSGVNSQIRVDFPSDALYTFDLGVNSGRYQFKLDDDYILKTAESNTSVTYFVEAGVHDLTLIQDSSAGADWSVDVSGAGNGNDSLPYNKDGQEIGGTGNDFTEEWLPIHLDSAAQVNLALSATGTNGDSLTLQVGGIFSETVYAGETSWASLDLPAGTTNLHLQATGNADPAGYALTVESIPDPTYTWSGQAAAAGQNSRIRLNFPASALYTFALDVNAGRYQFLLDDQYIQKTAETNTSVTFFVPAGLHDLSIDQDTTQGADWAVTITQTGASNDSLPYQKSGGDLGGSGNDFTEAWLPLNLGAGARVNLQMSLSGDAADSLQLSVQNALTDTTILSLDPLFGTETVWATFDVPADGARLHLVADGNTSALSYQLELDSLPRITGLSQPSYVWSGVSLNDGLNSTVRLDTQISGTYHFGVEMPQGFTSLLIDSTPLLKDTGTNRVNAFFYEFEADLAAGLHTFVSDQEESGSFPVTSWIITTTLLAADPPSITSVDPVSVTDDVATTVTLTGANFMPGATVSMTDGTDTYPLSDVSTISGSTLTAVVPAGLPEGMYDVVVTNPDDQTATLSEGIQVYSPEYTVYMPAIFK